jgi:membrane associated rhomboid family serine protease
MKTSPSAPPLPPSHLFDEELGMGIINRNGSDATIDTDNWYNSTSHNTRDHDTMAIHPSPSRRRKRDSFNLSPPTHMIATTSSTTKRFATGGNIHLVGNKTDDDSSHEKRRFGSSPARKTYINYIGAADHNHEHHFPLTSAAHEDIIGTDYMDMGLGIEGIIDVETTYTESERKKQIKNVTKKIGKFLYCFLPPGKRLPLFCVILLCIQFVWLVLILRFGGTNGRNPMIGPSRNWLSTWGYGDLKKIKSNGEIYRLFTTSILPVGVFHFIWLAVWECFLIPKCERFWGYLRVGFIYIMSGLGGTVMSCVFLPDAIDLGCLSCLIGLLAALLAELFLNWLSNDIERPCIVFLSLLFKNALFLGIGFLPFSNNFANFGGFLMGFASAFLVLQRQPCKNSSFESSMYKIYLILRLVSLLIILCFFCAMILLIFLLDWECKLCQFLNPDWKFFFQ